MRGTSSSRDRRDRIWGKMHVICKLNSDDLGSKPTVGYTKGIDIRPHSKVDSGPDSLETLELR